MPLQAQGREHPGRAASGRPDHRRRAGLAGPQRRLPARSYCGGSAGRPDYKPKVSYHVPAPGDVVPDYKLRNQDGRMFDMSKHWDHGLVVTFIYTRCPSPNFCPRMMHNFASLQKLIAANPTLSGAHLLCVSFDPDHDTPRGSRPTAPHISMATRRMPMRIGIWPYPINPHCLKMAKFSIWE